MNLFLITYDYKSPFFNEQALHQYIRDNKYINGWWHWLPGIYIIRTPLEHATVNQLMKVELAHCEYLVMKLDNTTRSMGMLLPAAWEWLNTNGEGLQGIAALFPPSPPPKGP